MTEVWDTLGWVIGAPGALWAMAQIEGCGGRPQPSSSMSGVPDGAGAHDPFIDRVQSS